MAAFYGIIALLLIYSHSTNTAKFTTDVLEIGEHLLFEKTFLGSVCKTINSAFSSAGHEDIVCDVLKDDEKQSLCEKMRLNFVLEQIGFVYNDYGFADSKLPIPEIVGPGDPNMCRPITVQTFDVEKRMFWCESKQFRGGPTLEYQEMEGFFLASGQKEGRVFAFRPSKSDKQKVSAAAEMNNVDILLKHVFDILDED